MRKIFYCLVVAMFLAACGKEDLSLAPIEDVNPYAVTPDEAVQLLQTVIGGESTRAISVGAIKTLRKSDFVPTTRGSEDEDIIYIVDLESGGSAIMGADKRMEPIYAILDETKISPEQLMLTATRSDSGEEDIEDFLLGALNNAIQMDSRALIPTLPELPRIPRPVYWTETEIIAQKAPLLRTKWYQTAPFNNNCDPNPLGGNYYAGCVAIATAQIMYYHSRPNSINGVVFDWDLISQYEFDYPYYPSPSAEIEVANFIYRVAEGVESQYTPQRTLSDIYYAKNLLQTSGYSNVTLSSYALLPIRTKVANNLPVLVQGKAANSSYLHAWVIDGCDIYEVQHWVREYQTELLYNEYIESRESHNLLHCNFGEAGKCDGYYSSGVFDMTNMREEGEYEPDYGDIQYTGDYDYTLDLQIVTYSLN